MLIKHIYVFYLCVLSTSIDVWEGALKINSVSNESETNGLNIDKLDISIEFSYVYS